MNATPEAPFLVTDAAREGDGIGPELIVVRRAHDGIEVRIDWEALEILCEDKHQAYLVIEGLRNLARAVGKRCWGRFGRKWKRSADQ
jgi:hypothetical protein